MAERESSTIALAPDSDLAARLAEASSSGAPLLVDAGGVLYRLEVHPAGAAAATSDERSGDRGSSGDVAR
jgi:hypothetical protein